MKLRTASLLAGLSTLIAVSQGHAQNAQDIVQTALDRYAERVGGVDDYTVVQDVMGTETTLHFEKEIVDGFPTFVPVSTFTVMQERIDAQRGSFLEAMARGGLSGVAPELSAASRGQFSDFLGAASEIGSAMLGEPGAAGDSPLESVRDVLVQGAARAGLETLAGELGGADAEQLTALAGGLTGLGDGSILGQLGKVALGEAESLALEKLAGALGAAAAGPLGSAAASALGGGGAGGLAGALGGATGGGAGGMGQQAMGGLAQAGLGALMGGVGHLATEAMMPDLSQMDQAARPMGPDPNKLLRLAGEAIRVEGSESIDGSKCWILGIEDLSALDLPDAEDFTPTDLSVAVDKQVYVVRRASVSGDLQVEGERVPVTMRTRLEDYREVEGLLHPFRTVTLIQGMGAALSDEERQQFEQMRPMLEEQIKQMEKQLAEMPPEQREMAERMMQQQMPQMAQMMKQMEAMTGDEPTEITVQVLDLKVNEGRPEALRAFPSPERQP